MKTSNRVERIPHPDYDIDTYGNPIEIAPDGRKYLVGFDRAYRVNQVGGGSFVLHGSNRVIASKLAETRIAEVAARMKVDFPDFTPEDDQSILSVEALNPNIFPYTEQ